MAQIQDIFPVKCSHPQCAAQYSLSEFIDIIQLWGFICLESPQAVYFGFTCPKCIHTTLNDYPDSNASVIIGFLESDGIDVARMCRGVRPSLRAFVTFSANGQFDSPNSSDISQDQMAQLPPFAVPVQDRSVSVTEKAKFQISEGHLDRTVAAENERKSKLLPRIVAFNSVYKKAERLLNQDADSGYVLRQLLEMQYGERRSAKRDPGYYSHAFSHLIDDDLTMPEYSDIFRALQSGDAHWPATQDIRDGYRQVRNRIDFETIYRTQWLNPIAKNTISRRQEAEAGGSDRKKDADQAAPPPKVDKTAILEKLIDLESRFPSLERIVTQNMAMMELKCKIAEISPLQTDILIVGETGTGKELIARAIHETSGRNGDFVPVNCGSIPKDLFESELFGHKKGAFSGAVSDKPGAFESAKGGTLFLDELGEMPIDLQAKLLRAIEYREIKPVGSEKPIEIDVKIVFATNRILENEIEQGNFRQDLYYRINSPNVQLPRLGDRVDDIPLLADHFRKVLSERFEKAVQEIHPDAIKILKQKEWNGNVRELMKVMESAVLNSTGDSISDVDIESVIKSNFESPSKNDNEQQPSALKVTDEQIIYWMNKLGNNKSSVAKQLGVTSPFKVTLA